MKAFFRALYRATIDLWHKFMSFRHVQAEDKEWLRDRYFDIGTHYYAAARYAYFARAVPTAGNLFHHAVEMYLKGYLCFTLDEGQRKKLRHSLRQIWRRFKRESGDNSVVRFNRTIIELDKFEDLRYPESVHGWLIHFELTRPATGGSSAKLNQPVFQLFLTEIDELVEILFRKGDCNPHAFQMGLSEEGKVYLKKDNATGIW